MRHRTIAIIAILTLLLFFMIWSFGSSAANRDQVTVENGSSEANATVQRGDEDEVDADLGKWGARIDRETYLRLRDEYIARKRGIEPGRPFNPELRGEAIEQMERQEKGRRIDSLVSGNFSPSLSPDSVAPWIPLGPMTIANGQPLSGGNTAVSGRVTAVVVDPTNSNNVYLGTAQGGVWRSQDGGSTWQAIFDNAQSLAIGALALAPSNPTILYVGTGEFNSCGDCFFGVGLYRIDTVNTTPTLVGPINPSEMVGNLTYSVFNGRGITKIVVDSTNAANIFVSTGRGVSGSGGSAFGAIPNLAPRGLWRSNNATSAAGSVTFQKLVVTTDASVDTPGTGNVDTTDIVMEPGVPNNLLVAVIGATATNGGIYKTTTALTSATFTQVYPAATGVRTNLAINKVGSVVTAYAATSESASGTSCTSTTQSGAVRKQVDPFNSSADWSTKLVGGGGFCGTQCFYDIAIAVNPTDASEVYLGGSARGSGGCSDGMKKSTDGGATFTRDDTGIHADSHALFYDGAGNVYTGDDGGVWKRSSSAAAGTAWTNLNSTPLNTLQFESIAVHPTDRDLMIGGTQDNGTEYQQSYRRNWNNAEGGDGGYALIDQSVTDTTNVTMYHTFFNQINNQIGFDRIINTNCLPIRNVWPTRGAFGGSPDPTIVPCDGTANYIQNGINIGDAVLFYAPMALGPGAPNTVYFGSDRLYRSTDRGDTMTVVSQASISNVGNNGSPISTIAVAPQDDNYRIVGLQNGQVWATSTGSATLVDLAPPFPTNPSGGNKFIGRAVIDPANKNVAYVALSYYSGVNQGIWKIANLGAAAVPSGATPNWIAAATGIPSVPINALVIDPTNSSNIFAGTDIGVYNSTDGGASWAPFGTGLPRVAVFDLQIQPTSRFLRAATHGRGVWEITISPTNFIDQTTFFVTQHYLDFLNRQPDASGLNFWVSGITSCGSDQNCIDVKRVDTSAAFYLSIEFQQTGYLVYRIYKSAFGVTPVPVKLSDFLPDTQTIGNGVIVGQGNWQQQLETNKQAFTLAFVQRARFVSDYPTGMTPSAFVDQLFSRAGVTPSTGDRNAAIGEFGTATTSADINARSRALRDVAENSTLVTQEFNKAFVLMQYFGYLRRNPNDFPDLNFDGYNFWLNKLNQFNGDFRNAEMVKAFITSIEFRQRFGP